MKTRRKPPPPAAPVPLPVGAEGSGPGNALGVEDIGRLPVSGEATPSAAVMPPNGTSIPSAGPSIRVAVRSDIGRVRHENQDSVFALTALLPAPNTGASLPFGFYAVADGMGGLTGGGVASRTALTGVAERVIQELLLGTLAGGGGQQTVADVLTIALNAASAAIHKAARRTGSPSGTTFSGIVLLGRQMVLAHVGDSRVYLEGPDGLAAITEDHSVVGRLVALGQLTPEEARHSPQRNALYRSLGGGEQVAVQSASYAWAGYRCILICSDGLWDQVPDAEIAAILRTTPDPDAAADELVALANHRGGPDNISVILVTLPGGAT